MVLEERLANMENKIKLLEEKINLLEQIISENSISNFDNINDYVDLDNEIVHRNIPIEFEEEIEEHLEPPMVKRQYAQGQIN